MTTLFLTGGVALIALGIGLILANPELRRSLMPLTVMLPGLIPSLGNGKLEELGKLAEGETESLKLVVNALLPDIERYLKAKAM
jgi:hypothetical protein